jgi:hypothetical protein
MPRTVPLSAPRDNPFARYPSSRFTREENLPAEEELFWMKFRKNTLKPRRHFQTAGRKPVSSRRCHAVDGRRAVGRKKRELMRLAAGLVEDSEAAFPGEALAVVDLAGG